MGPRAMHVALQEDEAIVWELLGSATAIWHLATAQLQAPSQAHKQAADQIFGYWTSRQAWLVSGRCFAMSVVLYSLGRAGVK